MDIRVKAIISVLITALIFGAGFLVAWHWQKNEYTAQIKAIQTANAEALKTISDKATATEAAYIKQHNADQAVISAQETQRLKDAQNAQAQIDKLHADVDSGAKRLRIAIATSHPASSSNTAGPASTASRPDADTAELAPSARQAYYDLRQSIDASSRQITGLQDYVKVLYASCQN